MHGIRRRNSTRIKRGGVNPLKADVKANCAMPKPFDGTDKVGGTMILGKTKVLITHADKYDLLDGEHKKLYAGTVGKVGIIMNYGEDDDSIRVKLNNMKTGIGTDGYFSYKEGEYKVVGENVWMGGKR